MGGSSDISGPVGDPDYLDLTPFGLEQRGYTKKIIALVTEVPTTEDRRKAQAYAKIMIAQGMGYSVVETLTSPVVMAQFIAVHTGR